MKSIELQGATRTIGTTGAKKLRASGNIPCVLYGGEENVHFSVNEIAFDKLIFTPEVFEVKLNVEGKEYRAIIKEVQYHPVSDRAIHIDFVQLFEDKPAVVALPVILEGNSIGVRNGGKLSLRKRKVKLKGLPSALPENVVVNIDKLKIGQSIKASAIEIEGVEVLETPNDVIVGVKTSRKAVAAEDEEEGEEAAAEGAEAPAEA